MSISMTVGLVGALAGAVVALVVLPRRRAKEAAAEAVPAVDDAVH